jgi:uncharacterized membrane protein
MNNDYTTKNLRNRLKRKKINKYSLIKKQNTETLETVRVLANEIFAKTNKLKRDADNLANYTFSFYAKTASKIYELK